MAKNRRHRKGHSPVAIHEGLSSFLSSFLRHSRDGENPELLDPRSGRGQTVLKVKGSRLKNSSFS